MNLRIYSGWSPLALGLARNPGDQTRNTKKAGVGR
jgi:hypothetical protein